MKKHIYGDRHGRRCGMLLCASVLAAALMLSACGGSENGKNPSGQTQTVEETDASKEHQESQAETQAAADPDAPLDFNLIENPQDYITVSEDYKHIKVDASEFGQIDLQSRIDSLLTAYQTWEEVTDRTSLEGDKLVVDLVETVNGQVLQDEKDKEMVLGMEQAAPGLDQYLEGMSKGQEAQIELTYPEDFYDETLAGNKAVFDVSVKSISYGIVPDYTDPFIAEHTDCSTIEEWETALKEKMKKEQIDSAVSLWLTENSELTAAADSLRQDYLNEAASWYRTYADTNNMTYEEFLDTLGYESDEDFLASDELNDLVTDQMRDDMLYAYIMKKENLTGTYGEYQKYLESFAAEAGYADADALTGMYTDKELKTGFLKQLVLDHLEESVILEGAD